MIATLNNPDCVRGVIFALIDSNDSYREDAPMRSMIMLAWSCLAR